VRTKQRRIRRLQLARMRTGQLRTKQPRPARMRTGQLRTKQPRPVRMRTGQLRTKQLRPVRMRTRQLRTKQPRLARVRTGQPRTKQLRPARTRIMQPRRGPDSPLPVRQLWLTRSLLPVNSLHLGLKPHLVRRARHTRRLQLVRSLLRVLRKKRPKPKSARGSSKLTASVCASLFECKKVD